MTADCPDFLEASGGSLSPAKLIACVAAWRRTEACLHVACRFLGEKTGNATQFCHQWVERAVDEEAVPAACGDPPAARCNTCARDIGYYCELEADDHHPAWHTSGGVHGGVPCPGWLAKTGGATS